MGSVCTVILVPLCNQYEDVYCLGMLGALKVMMKVLVFLLLPESSFTVMLVMSETPWGFSSLIISSLSQSTSGPHRMTPFNQSINRSIIFRVALVAMPLLGHYGCYS